MKNEQIQQNNVPIGWLIIGLLTFLAFISSAHGQTVSRVETVGFTVSDMARTVCASTAKPVAVSE